MRKQRPVQQQLPKSRRQLQQQLNKLSLRDPRGNKAVTKSALEIQYGWLINSEWGIDTGFLDHEHVLESLGYSMDQALEGGWIRKASHNGYQLNIANTKTVQNLSLYLHDMIKVGKYDAYPWIYLDTFDTRIDRSFETAYRFTAETFQKVGYDLNRVFGDPRHEVENQ